MAPTLENPVVAWPLSQVSAECRKCKCQPDLLNSEECTQTSREAQAILALAKVQHAGPQLSHATVQSRLQLAGCSRVSLVFIVIQLPQLLFVDRPLDQHSLMFFLLVTYACLGPNAHKPANTCRCEEPRQLSVAAAAAWGRAAGGLAVATHSPAEGALQA